MHIELRFDDDRREIVFEPIPAVPKITVSGPLVNEVSRGKLAKDTALYPPSGTAPPLSSKYGATRLLQLNS